MMNSLANVCWAECLKLRRSRAPWMTSLAYAMAPFASALLLLSTSRTGWPLYLTFIAGATAIAGLIVFSLLLIWIFGREHADHTSKELLTLPVPREVLVAGKILVSAAWCLLLQAGMVVLALLLGAALRLPFWSPDMLPSAIAKIFGVAALTFCLALPFGFVANLSRGTMGAVGVLFLGLFFAAIMAALGWQAYFPWSIPANFSGALGTPPAQLGWLSLALVFFTGVAGAAGSMIWWRRADQR